MASVSSLLPHCWVSASVCVREGRLQKEGNAEHTKCDVGSVGDSWGSASLYALQSWREAEESTWSAHRPSWNPLTREGNGKLMEMEVGRVLCQTSRSVRNSTHPGEQIHEVPFPKRKTLKLSPLGVSLWNYDNLINRALMKYGPHL